MTCCLLAYHLTRYLPQPHSSDLHSRLPRLAKEGLVGSQWLRFASRHQGSEAGRHRPNECCLGLDHEVLASFKEILEARLPFPLATPVTRTQGHAHMQKPKGMQNSRGHSPHYPDTNSKHTTFLGFSPRCISRKGRVREKTSYQCSWPGILPIGVNTNSSMHKQGVRGVT